MSDYREWRNEVLARYQCGTCGGELRVEQSLGHDELRIEGQCGQLEPCAAKELERDVKAAAQRMNEDFLSRGTEPEFGRALPDKPAPEVELVPAKEKP